MFERGSKEMDHAEVYKALGVPLDSQAVQVVFGPEKAVVRWSVWNEQKKTEVVNPVSPLVGGSTDKEESAN